MDPARTLIGPACVAVVCAALAAGSSQAQQKQPAGPSDPNRPASAQGTAPSSPPAAALAAPWHDDPNIPAQQDSKALDVLRAGLKAMGGEDLILGRRTIYIKRKVTNFEYPDPREGTITVWFKRPDKIRKEVAYDETTIDAFDGSTAWFDGGQGPQVRQAIITAIIAEGLKELDLPANYLDADLTYFNISQEIPGKLMHVVKTRKNGYTRELLFDVTTGLLEICAEYESPWGATDRMKKFARYRPVDGMMIPFHEEHWRSSRLVLETEILEIKFNEPIDDAIFTFPPSLATSPGQAPAGKPSP